MSEKVKIFIELTRLNKPIGFMLLFWPCIWGLTISYDFSLSLNTYFIYKDAIPTTTEAQVFT